MSIAAQQQFPFRHRDDLATVQDTLDFGLLDGKVHPRFHFPDRERCVLGQLLTQLVPRLVAYISHGGLAVRVGIKFVCHFESPVCEPCNDDKSVVTGE